jgi:phosphoribosyl-ATP pyrophosphohydrolase
VSDVLDAIAAVVAERRSADPETSYVASLNVKGIDKILEKVGEEAIEVVLAAKNADSSTGDSADVINEVADLVFHILVMLDRLDISHNDVMAALAARQGVSGLEEKASRNAD